MRTSSVEKIIQEILSSRNEHLTSLEVYEGIRERLPAVNPSTVYRALERLVHRGEVSVADIGTGAAVYQIVDGRPHHHLVCQGCGHTITVSDRDVHEFFAKLSHDNHFHILTNHLILFGLCPACQDSCGLEDEETPA